eukprot:UN18092
MLLKTPKITRFEFGALILSVFSKNAQNQRAKFIFSKKKAKILLFNFGLFQQVLLA